MDKNEFKNMMRTYDQAMEKNIRKMYPDKVKELVVPEKPYFQRKMVKKVRVFIQQSVENGF